MSDTLLPPRPSDNAWLWADASTPDILLTRREAAVIDVMGRASEKGMSTTAIVGAIAPNIRLPSFYDVLTSLEAKGYAKVIGTAGTSGRPAQVYALTDLGDRAAEFAAAVATHVLDDEEAMARVGERCGIDLLTLLLDTRCEHAVMTSDGGGYRVEKVDKGRYLSISDGPADRHGWMLAWLRRKARISDLGDVAGEGFFPYAAPGKDGRTIEVVVRITPELVGYRTTIGIRPIFAAPASDDVPATVTATT